MLFHNWIPPPIMITKEKLNTYPPLFSETPMAMASWGFYSYTMAWWAVCLYMNLVDYLCNGISEKPMALC